MDCVRLVSELGRIAVIKDCDMVADGALRLQTIFQYPDGSFIDVFFVQIQDMFHPYKISDYGGTTSYLLDLPMNPWSSKRAKDRIAWICNQLDVSHEDGELFIHLTEEDIPNAPPFFKLHRPSIVGVNQAQVP